METMGPSHHFILFIGTNCIS